MTETEREIEAEKTAAERLQEKNNNTKEDRSQEPTITPPSTPCFFFRPAFLSVLKGVAGREGGREGERELQALGGFADAGRPGSRQRLKSTVAGCRAGGVT